MNLFLVENKMYVTLKNKSFEQVLREDHIKELKEKIIKKKVTESYIKKLLKSYEKKQKSEYGIVTEISNSLVGNKEYYKRSKQYFKKGIPIPIPELLATRISDAIKNKDTERYTAYTNFWGWCSVLENPVARDGLFSYLTKKDFTITTEGFIVTYRNVKKYKGEKQSYHNFITTTWFGVKKMKKNPAKYYVVLDGNGWKRITEVAYKTVDKDLVLGTVDYLYKNLGNEVIYTDNHSGSTRIKIGEPVFQNRDECDHNPNVDCSRGLHLGNHTYVKSNWLGSIGLVCLLNPKDVVCVPFSYTNKLRCCRYLPISLINYDSNGKIILPKTDVYDIKLKDISNEDLMEEYSIDDVTKIIEDVHKKRKNILKKKWKKYV